MTRIRKALATVALSAAIVAGTAGVASARPVSDPTGTPYCGPEAIYVGANGDANGCATTELGPDPMDDAGIFGAIGAAWAVAWLLL